jgi:hypothetical protein
VLAVLRLRYLPGWHYCFPRSLHFPQSPFDPSGSAGPRQVATIRTAADGSYTRAFTASRSGSWTVKFGGSSSLQPHSASDAVCVYAAGRWQCPVSSTNPDLDCPDIGRTVWVGTRDYHRLDADDDGWGCDSY